MMGKTLRDLTKYDYIQGSPYADTGRMAENPGERLDSWLGAPVRTAISTAQKGKWSDILPNAWRQAGRDPQTAPTGVDLAWDMGIRNPYAGAAMATLLDLSAQVPVAELGALAKAEGIMPGVTGAVKKTASKGSSAQAILDAIKTPEQAAALKGAERQKYLNALDEVYGSRQKRAQDLGFGEKTWYHGTNVPIEQFKAEAKGLSTNAQSAKKGYFFAQDPSTASDYAQLAHEKGVIREGDNVTTKWMSDTYQEPEKLGYSHYGNKRSAYQDLLTRKQQEQKRLKTLADWEKIRNDPNSFAHGAAKREGVSVDEYISNKTRRIQEPVRLATKKEIQAAKADYYNSLREFTSTNDSDYAAKILGHDLDSPYIKGEERQAIIDAIKYGEDINSSGGQNVVPVRLKGNKDTIHVKDYKGQGYRDSTYADEMTEAQKQGKSAVLFKNTYDAADPYNKVQQNIAAVFEPNQIRSVNAAFDPRFKDSTHLLAGKAGVNPLQSGASLLNTFDPDKYLSEKQTFDPDAYIKAKRGE